MSDGRSRLGGEAVADPAPTGRAVVLNGPNLGQLGVREPAVYGSASHADLVSACRATGRALGLDVLVRQSDWEGELVGWLHEAADQAVRSAAPDGLPVVGVVLNAGALSHYSYALRDAVASLVGQGVRVVDVHLSNPAAREEFRHVDVLAGVSTGTVAGFGFDSYRVALRLLADRA